MPNEQQTDEVCRTVNERIKTAENLLEGACTVDDANKALAEIEQSIRLVPDDVFAYELRAECHRVLGDGQAVVKDLIEMILLMPNDADCLRERANHYVSLGEARRAYEDADRAVQLSPQSPDSFLTRGMALESLKDLFEARKDFTRYRELLDATNESAEEFLTRHSAGYSVELESFNNTLCFPYTDKGADDMYTLGHALRDSALLVDVVFEPDYSYANKVWLNELHRGEDSMPIDYHWLHGVG